MRRNRWRVVCLVLAVASCRQAPAQSASDQQWWADVRTLAADDMQGRKTGTDGYWKAADHVRRQFADIGLQPAGTDGYLQVIPFESKKLIEERSSIELRRSGKSIPLAFGTQAIAFPLGAPGDVDAGLAFVGYGLTIPEYHYDDFQDVETKGKVVVVLGGAPAGVPSTVAAHFSSLEEATRNLEAHGAVGTLIIENPRLAEVPWERMAAVRSQFAELTDLTEPALSVGGGQKVTAVLNASEAGVLFEGSGIDLKHVLDADAAKQLLPHGPLTGTLRARMVGEHSRVTSANIVALLPGSDPMLKNEYVVLSAHLDHAGVGSPVNGDAIYNGAMDNASGVATLVEVARVLHQRRDRPKRSILFVACTGEEEGLLGSKYYAAHPTVPIANIVADINLDMFLPIIPMRIVRGYGVGESTLAEDLNGAADELGLSVQDDPHPEHNAFIRSDQYSFIKQGVPALFVSIGYAPNSAEEKIVTEWQQTRYHQPGDDTTQPIDHQSAARFNQLMTSLAWHIANATARPHWNANSFFARFSAAAAVRSGR